MATKRDERRERPKLERPSLLCIFISNQKSIRDVMNTKPRKSHSPIPNLTYTLSSKKNVDIHIKSKTALVWLTIVYTLLRELLTLINRIKSCREATPIKTKSM